MKKYFTGFFASVLLLFAVVAVNAQSEAAPTAAHVIADPNVAAIKKANSATAHIEAVVKITGEQRTKLRAALLNCITKFDAERIKAKNDDAKLASLRTAMIEEMKASIKTILTPGQFETVMSTEAKN